MPGTGVQIGRNTQLSHFPELLVEGGETTFLLGNSRLQLVLQVRHGFLGPAMIAPAFSSGPSHLVLRRRKIRDLLWSEPPQLPISPFRDRVPRPLVGSERIADGSGQRFFDDLDILNSLDWRADSFNVAHD